MLIFFHLFYSLIILPLILLSSLIVFSSYHHCLLFFPSFSSLSFSSALIIGEVSSFEVCPSRVRITRRLSYSELDEVLAREETTGRIVESLLTDSSSESQSAVGYGGASSGSMSGSGSVSLSQGAEDSRMSRGNLGE